MKVLIGLVVFMVTVNIDQACVVNGKVYEDGDTWVSKIVTFLHIKKRSEQIHF